VAPRASAVRLSGNVRRVYGYLTWDKIAVVVSGLAHPLLLRPVEGGYKVLAHIYLRGIMYGEVWPGNDSILEDLILV
jgi:hypothetical protein